MKSKEYIYSVKQRSGYADKNKTVFEVMVAMPHYKNKTVSVGGKAYTFEAYQDAMDDIEQRILEKTANGFIASVATS